MTIIKFSNKFLNRLHNGPTLPAWIVCGALALSFVACHSPQKAFCDKAAQQLCSRCDTCGTFASCGLLQATTKAQCIANITQICEAYDSVYTPEVGRICLEQIDKLPCDILKQTGKPEICTRLF